MKRQTGFSAPLTLILSFTILIFSGISFAAEQRNEIAPVQVEVLEDTPDLTRLNIQVDGFDVKKISIEEGDFNVITIGSETTIARSGYPDLPFISRSVLIPPQSDVRLEINNITSYIEHGLNPIIAPDQENGEFTFTGECEDYISREGFWPPEPLVLGSPAIMRGWRIINFQYFPMQYNHATGEMRINSGIEFDLRYEGVGENIVENPDRIKPSIYVYKALQSLVENPPPLPQRDDFLMGSYLYIVPEANNVPEAVEPLIEWRRRQGHRVAVEYVDNGEDSGTLRNIINDYYDSDDPIEFVGLVGDAGGQISLSAASANGDYGYTRLDGNDPLPDIAIGRITCDNVNTLENVINKLVSYESNPYMQNTDWFRRGCVVAGNSVNGLGTVLVAKWVRKELLDIGFEEVLDWYHNEDGNIGGNQPFLTDAVESGISIMHYRAYMNMNNLNLGVLYNMNNRRGRWPAVLAISCATGSYVNRDAHTEAWFKSRGGGIGAIGTATAGTHVQYNNIMAGGVWKAIYKDELYAFGWGLNGGKTQLWRAYHGLDGSYMNFMDWNNLMGDPGTIIWTDIPAEINVERPDEFQVGGSRFRTVVTYDEDDEPVAEALVCLYKEEELHEIKYTNDDGIAEFSVDPEALTDGTLHVTVTKHNHKSYLEDIDVVDPDNFIGISGYSLDDDNNGESEGDNDEIANPSETIELNLFFLNYGENAVQGEATITLESLTPWAEVLGDPVELDEEIAPNDNVETTFVIRIAPDCPDQMHCQFGAVFAAGDNEWESSCDVVVESPKIQVMDVHYDPGNSINPGQVKRIDLTLRNTGHKEIDDFTARIETGNDILRVIEGEADYNSINENRVGRVDGAWFRISAHPFTVPGMVIPVTLTVETETGFVDTDHFSITVGEKTVDDPLGPDEYGYICLDSGDDDWEYAPEYDWVEIDPDENGNHFNGRELNLPDRGDNQDRSVAIDLPFDFQYYGEEFDEITICSNGWAAFGDQSELADFRNRRIGQALGPNAQLCAWWDNLLVPNDAGVFHHYDDDGGRFIIEWNNVGRLLNGGGMGARETFEIILYDPAVHPTITGDGIIVFQYKEVHNENRPAHNDTPFCTIGISNLDDSGGIEYTYWDQYPAGAREIEDEMALLFITRSDFRTGVLRGVITDHETGDPIENASVLTTHGFWAETNENGEYLIDNILVEDGYEVTAYAQGWNDSTVTDVDVPEEDEVVLDFSLLHPEFAPSDEQLMARIPIDNEVDLDFTITNEGNGPLDWHVERHLIGDANAAPWELRNSYYASDSTDDSRIQGAIFINDMIYAAGAGDDDGPQMYVFNRDGELVDQYDQLGNDRYGYEDMAWDGEWIWASGQDMVYAFTPDGEEMARFDGPYNPNNNFAWDSDREVLWIASTTSDISAVDREGNVIEELDRLDMRMYGFAYYPDDPDGYPLYIFVRDAEIDEPIVYKMNPDNNDTNLVAVINMEEDGRQRPSGAFITNRYDVYSWVFFAAINNGANDRIDVLQVDARREWYRVEPETGTIEAGDEQDFTLTLDATGLPEVEFTGDLVFYHNANNGEDRIRVTLDVVPPVGQPDERILSMNEGWNMVSLNVEPEIENIVGLFQPLVEQELVLLVKDGLGRFYHPPSGFDNIRQWEVQNGYQINLTEAVDFEIEGLTVAQDEPIPLERGWNLKAYFPTFPIEAPTALANIAGRLEIAKDGLGHFYMPEFEFSNMGEMQPCKGYQFKVTEDLELVYNLEAAAAASVERLAAPEHYAFAGGGESNMSVLAIAGRSFSGWELGVFNESGALTGSGRFDSNGRCGAAVWGDDPQTEPVEGMAANEALTFRVWNGETEFEAGIEPLKGGEPVWTDNGVLAGNLILKDAVPVEFGVHQAYPNPFNSMVRLSYGIPEAGFATLTIYDLTGRTAAELAASTHPAGSHTLTWNAENVPSGLYFARLEFGGEVSNVKLMLVR